MLMLGSREEKVALKAMWHDAKHYLPTMGHMPPWRNWLARSAVNRKVGGSSPPGGEKFFESQYTNVKKKVVDLGRTRTCNPLIRSQMPYPLGHRAIYS